MSYQSLVKYIFGFEGRWDSLHTAKKSGGSRTVPGQCGAMASELLPSKWHRTHSQPEKTNGLTSYCS